MTKKNCTAIFLGAGRGLRLKAGKNKIFIDLKGKSLLQRTTENILKFPAIHCAIFVAHYEDRNKIKQILRSFWKWEIPFEVIIGGEERWQSSIKAVAYYQKKIPKKNSFFFLHDLARPFVSLEQIKTLYQVCIKKKVSAPYLKFKDTIRQNSNLTTQILERNSLFCAQTPQFFNSSLAKFFQAPPTSNEIPSDDIFFVEKAGIPVAWVLGEDQNFKITTSFDIEFAKFLLQK